MFINPVSSLHNYPINRPSFKGRNWWEISGSQNLIHETAFFREPDTDDFVTNYVRKNLSSKREINIVSAGCATGEEAYTYAMLLDDMRDKVKIKGFDLSTRALDNLRSEVFYISKPTPEYFLSHKTSPDFCRDSYLAFDSYETLSEQQLKNKEKFNKYFYEMKSAHSYISNFETKTFVLNPVLNRNCSFCYGDVTKLDDILANNSVDVFSMKNLLYHIVSVDDDSVFCLRSEKENAEEIKNEIFSSIYRKLAPNGILVLGEHEYLQGVDPISTSKVLHQIGFVPVFTSPAPCKFPELSNKANFPNVWKKPNV